MNGKGDPNLELTREDIRRFIETGIPDRLVDGKKVLVLTPDATRTAPLPMVVDVVQEVVGRRAARCDYMVALGTHRSLSEDEIQRLLGVRLRGDGLGEGEGAFKNSRFMNHRWDLPETLVKIGTIEEREIDRITGGLFHEGIDVVINREIFNYDLLLILSPVFPHEVVGFSGGNKYLFPGISGGEFLHFFHWLGAVISNWEIIGHKDTPVRAVVNRATEFVRVPRHCVSMVVTPRNTLAGLYVGTPEDAWSAAADLSARIHVVYKEHPYHVVLGRAPTMYDELWTAGKVMYKLEPIVAENGTLIILAPHLSQISHTWGTYLERIGYHVRDYFLQQMDMFREVPRGVLAHSSHVRGLGSYENGVEKPRIEVVLATSIPERVCRKLNLGYMDPAGIRIEEYQNREHEGILFVDHAGEVLHRLA